MTPIYACHGIGMHSGFFDRQAAALAPRPVVHVNMPGFGGEPLHGPTSFPDLATALAEKISAGGAPAHVMGHSMGGMVAQELAATRPELVRSLILCNTTPAFGGRDDTFKQQFVSARLAPLENGKTMAQMAPASVRGMSGPDTADEDLTFMADLMAETPEDAYRAAIECLVTFDRFADQGSYTMPILLIGGADDPAAPARSMEKMAEKMPDAELHILPGSHMTPVEQAARVNPLIKAFLERVEA